MSPILILTNLIFHAPKRLEQNEVTYGGFVVFTGNQLGSLISDSQLNVGPPPEIDEGAL